MFIAWSRSKRHLRMWRQILNGSLKMNLDSAFWVGISATKVPYSSRAKKIKIRNASLYGKVDIGKSNPSSSFTPVGARRNWTKLALLRPVVLFQNLDVVVEFTLHDSETRRCPKTKGFSMTLGTWVAFVACGTQECNERGMRHSHTKVHYPRGWEPGVMAMKFRVAWD